MHELKQFVDHSFQELPVSPEKSWILTNNIPKNEVTNQLSHIFSYYIHEILGEKIAYMMLLAMTALLSFPLVISQRFSKSRITITKNLFSCKKSP
jgi:hypothetical protein